MDNITKIQMFNKIGGIFSFIGMSLSTFDGDLQNDPNYVNWFISVTDKEDLKQMLQEMVKNHF